MSTPKEPKRQNLPTVSPAAPTSTGTSPTQRLHITPLTPAILPMLVPSSFFPSGHPYPPTVSYHTIPTFPENSYGYIDLPLGIAERLKKRLNGTVFRGVKVSVKEARKRKWDPEGVGKGKGGEEERAMVEEEEREGKRKRKRKRKEDGVFDGYELPGGRWIKRAWTKVPVLEAENVKEKDKDKKKRKEKGKKEAVQRGECLFKLTLPENVSAEELDDGQKKKKRKEKNARPSVDSAEEATKEEQRRKQEKKTVREFKNTTKLPQFLKSSQLDPGNRSGKVTEFVEGVGWVDAQGNVVDDSAVKRVKRREEVGGMDGDVEVYGNELVSRSDEDAEESSDSDSLESEESIDNHSSSEDEEVNDIESALQEIPEPQQKHKANPNVTNIVRGRNLETKAATQDVISQEDRDSSSPASSQSNSLESAEGGDPSDSENNKDEEKQAEKVRASTRSLSAETSFESSSDSELEHDPATASSMSDSHDSEEEEKEKEKSTPSTKANLENSLLPSHKSPPTLKLSIPPPSDDQPINTPHPLESLFKPSTTTTATAPSGGLFNFNIGDDDIDEDFAQEFTNPNQKDSTPLPSTPLKQSYRSAAPTPDTAIVNKNIQWPSSISLHGQGFFAPSTPVAPRKSVFKSADNPAEAPLLLQGNSDSAYLRGLSIWSSGHLPAAKSLTELPPPEDNTEGSKRTKKNGNANEVAIHKHKERKIGQGKGGVEKQSSAKDVWKQRFYHYRGEWNREWKNKKREAAKLERRKKRDRLGLDSAK